MEDAARQYLEAPLETLDLGPTQLAFRRFGAGPALLLVHGFPLSGFTWRRLLPELARHYCCYVPDLPGLGRTQWSAQTDFGWYGHARTLQSFLERLGVARCRVLAQDTGGSFARCLALLDGARIERLALINTEIPGHRPPWIPLYQALLAVPGTGAVFRRLLRSPRFLRSGMGFGGCFSDLGLLEGDFQSEFVTPLLDSPRRLEGLIRYLRSLRDWTPVDRFAQDHGRIAMPVRLIWGADDPTFPIAEARRMAGQFPRADLVEIPGARLLAHEEKPAEVLRAALSFFA